MRVLLTVEWAIDESHAADVYVRIGIGDPDPNSLLRELRRMVTANHSGFRRMSDGLESGHLAPGESASLCVYRTGRFQYEVDGVKLEATGMLVVREPGT